MSPSTVSGAVLGLASGAGLLLIVGAFGTRPAPRRRQGRLARLVREAGVPHASGSTVLGVAVVAGLLGGAVALVVAAVPAVGLLAAVAAGGAPILLLRRRAVLRRRQVAAAWPDAVDALLSGVRAGLSIGEALGDLARSGPLPLRAAFADFAGAHRASGSLDAALDELQSDLADPIADRVVAALRLTREFGGSDLGVVLRSLSTMLRQDGRLRGEIESRQSWTVTAARLAVAAPWLTLALLCTRPEGVRAYASPGGLVVLLLAAALSVLAYASMLRIGRLPAPERLAP